MSYDKCNKGGSDTIWGGVCGGKLRPVWMVTGCMCGAVSCRVAMMGANIEKENILLRHPPYRDTRVTIFQLNRPHRLTVALYVCVQAQRGWGYSKCRLSGSTDNHDELCTKVCVCVCEIAASAGKEHDKVGVLLRNQQAVAREGKKGSGKTWRKWIQRFEWESLWAGRVIWMWLMRKWRQRRQITPYDLNCPTLHINVTGASGCNMSVLYPGVEDVYKILLRENHWCLT